MKFTIIFIGIIVLCVFLLGHVHEQVHVEIYKSYGINSKVKYSYGVPSLTVGKEACSTDSCELAHNINDAIGYHLGILFFLFAMAFLIIIMILENETRKTRDK